VSAESPKRFWTEERLNNSFLYCAACFAEKIPMTVKATLAYGKNFHFYHEALDNNHIYLELEDVSYDVGYRRVMVAIPIDVWEVIRALGAAKLNLTDASDEELLRLVEERVNARIAEYERAKSSSTEQAMRLRFNDSLEFGMADEPREKQILRGVEYYKVERERQREVSVRISQHKIVDISADQLDGEDL
jgi:hypothetical protein